jgi:quercetin dioxygenase-like cupin family protein
MALATMQKARLAAAEREDVQREGVHGISKQDVRLDTVTVKKVRFEVGGATKGCMLAHVAYVVSGRIEVRMVDGSQEVFAAGDVMMLPPGHDAWTVGDEPCEFIEFSRGTDDYYAAPRKD